MSSEKSVARKGVLLYSVGFFIITIILAFVVAS